MPSPANEDDEEADADAEKKKIAKAALAKPDASDTEGESTEKPIRKAIAAHNGNGNGSSAESAGRGEGGGGASEFGWYGAMLHDRFYSEWTQPTTTVSSNSKISALVKIRIEQDGHVSNFEIIKPSGNVMIDESVAAIAKRVRQVDPLPTGLGHGGHYDVKINFELNSEQ
jgi:TonB family protein